MKLRRTFVALGLSVVLASLAVGQGAVAVGAAETVPPWFPTFRTSAPVRPVQIEVGIDLPKVPATVPVLATKTREVDAAALAAALGVEGKPFADGDKIHVEGPRESRPSQGPRPSETAPGEEPADDSRAGGHRDVLTVFPASGGVSYLGARRFSPPDRQPRLPAEDAARERAGRVLDSLGLMPEGVDGGTADVTRARLAQVSTETGRVVDELFTELEVRFPQEAAGHPVTGPGAKLYVAFGDRGRVVGVTAVARHLVDSGDSVRTIPAADAVNGLADGIGSLAVPRDCAVATVVDADLAYWTEAPDVAQHRSLPLYALQLRCEDAEGVELGLFPGYAPAVSDSGPLSEPSPDLPEVAPDRR